MTGTISTLGQSSDAITAMATDASGNLYFARGHHVQRIDAELMWGPHWEAPPETGTGHRAELSDRLTGRAAVVQDPVNRRIRASTRCNESTLCRPEPAVGLETDSACALSSCSGSCWPLREMDLHERLAQLRIGLEPTAARTCAATALQNGVRAAPPIDLSRGPAGASPAPGQRVSGTCSFGCLRQEVGVLAHADSAWCLAA